MYFGSEQAQLNPKDEWLTKRLLVRNLANRALVQPAASFTAVEKTASSIGSVNRFVNVFCWLG